MGPLATGMIVAGATDFLNAGGNFASNLFFGKRNEDWAREDADIAYYRQRQLLQEQRDYESPEAQMQRYMNAGLNPNLIYGQQQGGITPPSVPQASTPQISAPRLSLDLPYMQSKLMQAQIERLNTQNENDTAMTEADINRISSEIGVNEWEIKKAEAQIDLNKVKIDEIRQGISNMKEQFSILSEQKKQEQFTTAFMNATQDMRIKGANAEQEAVSKTAVALAMAKLLNVNSDTALNWSQKVLNEQYSRESGSRVALNAMQMDVAKEQANLLVQQVEQSKASTKSILIGLVGQQSYNRRVYGSKDDNWFMRGVHFINSEIDALTRMAGNVMNGHFSVGQ